jgi:transposase
MPKDLPREDRLHDIAREERLCGECGKELTCFGEDVSEQLEYNPSRLYVIRHRRKKYACRCCQGNVVVAAKPPEAIEKGLPGPGLLSQVVVSKYQDHLPLNRQEHILERSGVAISRSTLCGWVKGAAELLSPVVERMKREVLQSKKIHTDDTPVPVLDENLEKTRTGRVWVYVGDEGHKETVYEYTPSHERKWPKEFLGNYAGHLQADAYKGYDGVYESGKVVEVACWAHARRKFYEAKETDANRGLMALTYIGKLYQVEHEGKETSSQERKRLRQEKSLPVLETFRPWLIEQAKGVLPKSPMGGAIQYALGQWEALVRYTTDGDLAIDNNAAERALRTVVVGRKNWLFAGSDDGGRWAAIHYSIIESCKRNKIDPYRYLRDVFTRLAGHPMNRIEEFMPSRWRPPPACAVPPPASLRSARAGGTADRPNTS